MVQTEQCAVLASMIPAIFGVEHLCGTSPDEGGAARADRLTVGTSLHPLDVYPEEPQAIVAVTKFVRLLHIAATS